MKTEGEAMKIAKHLIWAIGLFFTLSYSYALEVSQDELNSAGKGDEIVFTNYTGPHAVFNTADQIRAIGRGLGRTIAKDTSKSNTEGNIDRYYVIHAVDDSKNGKLDADILILGKNAGVDHIANLRRIITGYLIEAFNYDRKDAETISTFVTVYNAVYRGKIQVFNEKYKDIVTANLTEDKCGLALNWEDWPGKTQIVIPLTDQRTGLSVIDTSVISDRDVVDSMQEDDGRGVNDRKNMVDLKEREADEATEKARQAQLKVTEDTALLAQEKAELELLKKEASDAEKASAEDPDNEQKALDAQKAKEAVEEQEQTVKEIEKQVAEDKLNAAQAQSFSDKKVNEAQGERATIAQDQAQLSKIEAQNEGAPRVLGLVSTDINGTYSYLVKLNGNTGNVLQKSDVNVIRARAFYEEGNNIIAIAGANVKNGAVKLVLIDKETLQIIKEGEEVVAETSVLVKDGSSYYCVVQEDKKFYTAKYSADLKCTSKSEVQVKPAAPITVTANGVITTGEDGKSILLDKDNLSLKTR